ncbi:MAG: DUF3800 domain-containing protein [Pseudomonadota bacterium]
MLYEVYIDESGTHGTNEIVLVGGYVMAATSAKKMERRWRARNQRFGVEPFHMVDCAHGSGDYKGTPKTKRAILVADLIAMIKKYTVCGFASAIPPQGRLGSFSDDAYSDSVFQCLALLTSIVKEQIGGKPRFTVYLEDGHQSKGLAMKALEDFCEDNSSIAGFGFYKKQDLCLLQAADLLVWQQTKFLKDQARNARPPRKDYLSLVEHPHKIIYNLMNVHAQLVYLDHDPSQDDEMRQEYISDFFGSGPATTAAVKSHLTKYQ